MGGRRQSGRRRRGRGSVLLGIDTGGTFTDFVCLVDGEVRVHKCLSTPDDPARAVLQGVEEILGAGPERPRAQVTYGSTVATNAVLERKGARVALLATEGFEDVIEIGRQTRPQLYDLEPEKPLPLVPRRWRVGVRERMQFDGKRLQALSGAEVARVVAELGKRPVDAVAVCLLHSYANPSHERRLGRALRRAGYAVSLSHELVAEYREYERTSTVVTNAYVAPRMAAHLGRLQRGLGAASVRVMQSSGGAIAAATAAEEPVRTLLSGPSGGVIGACDVAARLGIEHIITFDMGGTSTDVSLVDGAPRRHTEWSIDDLPVKVPAIDIHTVGAGGGSIARCDAGGALKVGPDSAGADPGPACYGRGRWPTVTDANLVLGRLAADAFLGGRMALDRERARTVLVELGRALGMDEEGAAEGVVRVVNASMERAIRRISVERGHDPRSYTLVAFGGAAGMHACDLAVGLGISRILLPAHPGLLSARGAATADTQRDYVQTVRREDPSPGELRRILAPIEARARAELRGEAGNRARIQLARRLDVRYRGQSYELSVPMSSRYRADFDGAHLRLYGYRDEQRPVEVVNVRVAAVSPVAHPAPAEHRSAGGESRPCRLRWDGRSVTAARWERSHVAVGSVVRGPALITELSSTTLIPPGWKATMQPTGDLLVEEGS